MKFHSVINVNPDGTINTRRLHTMSVMAERAFRDEIVAQGLYHSEWVAAFHDFQMLLDAINSNYPDAHYELRTFTVRP